jgi:LAO/AO transport system kinase
VTPPAASDRPDAGELAAALRAGDRRALARAITLAESTRADHRAVAEELLDAVLPDTGGYLRIGVSGPPGVGKSTLIESFGLEVLGQGHRVAVLAVDPSSTRSGGSILGDKTRMVELSREDDAFIRPSPSGGTLGGIARRTREAMLLCEAAGFDVVLVETVGVGQSEVAVSELVDLFCVLVAPGGGDELQGIKRGIMELADLVVVNKADGDLAPAAGRAAADYEHALHLLRPRWEAWQARVAAVSALERRGVDELWASVEAFRAAVTTSGELERHRAAQAVAWLWSEVRDALVERFQADPEVQAELQALEAAVGAGECSVASAARKLLAAFDR